jgi:putative tryptophan/tyrosine transport system substrate-binding protein
VQQGLVSNLSRPEGNITGATTLAVELGQKRLELLSELVPGAKLVAALVNPKGPNLAPPFVRLGGAGAHCGS